MARFNSNKQEPQTAKDTRGRNLGAAPNHVRSGSMQVQGVAPPMQPRGRASFIGQGSHNAQQPLDQDQRPKRESSLSGLNIRQKLKSSFFGMLGYDSEE